MNTIKQMTEDEKIIYIIEKIFCATDQDTSVTMEQVIEEAIKLGYTEDYPRGKEDGHPWIPRTSVMMGVGSEGMLISAVHHEEGEERLHLLMVDPHIPAGAKLY